MKIDITILGVSLILACVFSVKAVEPAEFTGSKSYKPDEPLTLWYTRPGTTSPSSHQWMDMSLPLGNGQLGALISGGIAREEISVNEKTLWSGDTRLQGSYSYGCYQNFGSLYVETQQSGPVTDYWRDLNLATGLARAHYKDAKGVTYEREFIASNPDNVIAARFTASKSGALELTFTEVPGMAKDHEVTYAVANDGSGIIEYHGKLDVVSYCSVIKIQAEGGTVLTDGSSISVKDASAAYVVIAAGTDYDPISATYTSGTENLHARVAATATAALTKGWQQVLSSQKSDHEALFGRVAFNLSGARNDIPTDEMRAKYRELTKDGNINVDDPVVKMLEMLYFHYGRYLAIGSSRGVALPANLQGIWSGFNVYSPYSQGQLVPWNGDIHSNINVQMNYWPSEPTNLSELHLPFLDYIINQATVQPQWSEYARNEAGQTKGWTCFTENNIFGGGGNFMTNYVIANAWYCTHLWQHYAYTLDKDFLTRALPTMWSACEFWLERLVKGIDGTWECPAEYSPEQGPGAENATAHSQQLVAELFANTIAATEALPSQTVISAAEIERLKEYYQNLDRGIAIERFRADSGFSANGLADGDEILREWKYSDFTAGWDGHRHLSHLMCLYPLSQIEPGTREFKAAVNSLRQRGDGATGWSLGWKINLWARAHDGDHARLILRNGLSHQAYDNLFDAHPPFQIDGNFGATAGIAEMLVQSLGNRILLLPALPSLWTEGEVRGLKAIGDFSIDMEWSDSKLKRATIVANQGGDLNIGYFDLMHKRIKLNGKQIKPAIVRNGATGLVYTVIRGLESGNTIIIE